MRKKGCNPEPRRRTSAEALWLRGWFFNILQGNKAKRAFFEGCTFVCSFFARVSLKMNVLIYNYLQTKSCKKRQVCLTK